MCYRKSGDLMCENDNLFLTRENVCFALNIDNLFLQLYASMWNTLFSSAECHDRSTIPITGIQSEACLTLCGHPCLSYISPSPVTTSTPYHLRLSIEPKMRNETVITSLYHSQVAFRALQTTKRIKIVLLKD